MAKFHILHLSDLHISDKLTSTLNALIRDVSNNKELINSNVIIVITGDIINRGNYKYRNTAIDFFDNLKKSFDQKKINIIDVQIVPGNHDKVIDLNQKISSIALLSNEKFPINSKERDSEKSFHLPTLEEIYNILESAFTDYLALCNDILEIFKNQKQTKIKDNKKI